MTPYFHDDRADDACGGSFFDRTILFDATRHLVIQNLALSGTANRPRISLIQLRLSVQRRETAFSNRKRRQFGKDCSGIGETVSVGCAGRNSFSHPVHRAGVRKPESVILGPSLVILNEAKNLGSPLRVKFAEDLYS